MGSSSSGSPLSVPRAAAGTWHSRSSDGRFRQSCQVHRGRPPV
jgi:hypothetical protein